MAGHTTFSILIKPPGFFFQGGHSSSEEDLFIDIAEDKTYSEEELCGDDFSGKLDNYFDGGYDTDSLLDDHFIDDKSDMDENDWFDGGKKTKFKFNKGKMTEANLDNGSKFKFNKGETTADLSDEFFGSAQRDTPANFDTFFTEQLNYF